MATYASPGRQGNPASVVSKSYGVAWLSLCAVLALHITDEALTGFLSVYNPTVLAMRERLRWFPMPVFAFKPWLSGLMTFVVLLFCLSPLAFRGANWLRYVAWPLAFLILLNAAGHTLGTIFGQTVSSVRFARPMPGFYSSPFLAAASLFLMWSLKKTAGANPRP